MKKRILAAVLAVMIGSIQIVNVFADKTQELQNQQEQKAQTSAALNNTEAQIDSLEVQKNALMNEISELDSQLLITMAAVENLKTEIANKQQEIEATQAKLAAAKQDQEEQYELMKKRIQFLYESGGDSAWLTLIMEGRDFGSILNQAEYTQKLYDYDRKCLEEYMEVVRLVTEYGEQLATEKADLEADEAEQEAQQAALEELLAQKRATSADYEAQIAQMEAKVAQYNELIREQNARIQQLQAEIEEERRQEEERRRQEEERRQREEQERQEAAERQAAADRAARERASANSDSDSSSSSGSSSSSSSRSTYTGGSTGNEVVDYALQFVGNPYVYGGNSLTNGIDCSGFVSQVYAHFGISVPRSSAELRYAGTGVSYSEAQPGDIICYSGHVAIYMGGGQIVHASNARDGIKVSSNAAYRTILSVRRIM